MPIKMSCSYERTLHAALTLDRLGLYGTPASEPIAFAALRYGPHGSRRMDSAVRKSDAELWLDSLFVHCLLQGPYVYACCLVCRAELVG